MNISSDFSDAQDTLLGPNSTYTLLLQRSRSSRARKPLSIRAAMQQAATYSNISRAGSVSHHSSHPSTGSVPPRQSTAAAGINNNPTSPRAHNFPALVADSYDGGVSAPASKKVTSDSARRKRPAFLAIQPEESDTVKDGQTLHTKRSKDQMRKSSPTVGDKFRFVSGEPNPEQTGAPAEVPIEGAEDDHQTLDKNKRLPSLPEDLAEPPRSLPPQTPLPIPPSRSSSRSRTPPSPLKSAMKGHSRTGSSSTLISNGRYVSSSPSKQSPMLEDQFQTDSPAIAEEVLEKPPTPPTPQTDGSVPPTPRSCTPQPRKQKSSSSVRDQIMVLPETARLRKQASNELLRKQTSEELLGQNHYDEPVPALPATHDRHVVGNAFGRQGYSRTIPRTSSSDMLKEVSRQRAATDISQTSSFAENAAQLSFRGIQGVQRSVSEARRPPHLKFTNSEIPYENDYSSPTSSSILTPSSLVSPSSQPPHSADSESWPLTPGPDLGHQHVDNVHETHYGARYLQHSESYRARSPFPEDGLSPGPSRSLSPDTTPRASRSITPHSSTPRQRSRSNTLTTIASDAGEGEHEGIDEGHSMNGSAAPSIMSAQWYRSPRERLNLIPRMSRAETIPWELGAEETDARIEHTRSRFNQKPRLGNVLAGRAPLRLKDEFESHSPPRSPLLTDGFLSNVKAGLPKDRPEIQQNIGLVPEEGPRPSTSMTSVRQGSESSSSKKSKKDGKPKDSRFPTIGDMFSEYKNMGNSWYTAQYARAAEDQRMEKESRDKRSVIGSSSSPSSPRRFGSSDVASPTLNKVMTLASPRPSQETSASKSSESANSRLGKEREKTLEKKREKEEKKKKKKGGSFVTMKEMWGEYRNNANSWYTAPYKEEHIRNIDTPQPHN